MLKQGQADHFHVNDMLENSTVSMPETDLFGGRRLALVSGVYIFHRSTNVERDFL